MKKLLFLLLLLLQVSFVLGATKQYANITLEVINRPPFIRDIQILPEQPYSDNTLICDVTIIDEHPETVTYSYQWFKNNELLDDNSRTLAGLTEYDNITCTAVGTDQEGETGLKKAANTTILVAPIRAQILKPVIATFAPGITMKDLADGTSMAAVTGMVTGTADTSPVTLVFMLSIFVIILLGINGYGFYLSRKNKH